MISIITKKSWTKHCQFVLIPSGSSRLLFSQIWLTELTKSRKVFANYQGTQENNQCIAMYQKRFFFFFFTQSRWNKQQFPKGKKGNKWSKAHTGTRSGYLATMSLDSASRSSAKDPNWAIETPENKI